MIQIRDTFYTSPLRTTGKCSVNYIRIMNRRDYSLVYESNNLGDVLKYVNEHDYANEDDLYVIINNDEVSR